MQNRQHNSRQVQSLMVTVLLSFVLALPLLSQPLGLSYAWNNPAGEAPAVDINSPLAETAEKSRPALLEPAEVVDKPAVVLSRGSSAPIIDPDDILPPAVLDGEELPDEISADETGMDRELFLDEEIPVLREPKLTFKSVNYTLYINANILNFRSGPTVFSEVIGRFSIGDKVTCIGENDEWMQISHNGQTGYLKTEFTSRDMVFREENETVYINANSLNMRAAPNTEGEIIATLSRNQRLTRTGVGDGWSRVRTSDGKIGYMVTEYLTTRAPVTTSASTSGSSAPRNSSGNKIVDYAYSALGVRYVHGGSSMSGFDCSGLTSWVYRQVGISIPRSTSGYYNLGYSVSLADIKPGDILALNTRRSGDRSTITHVGIYVGNGNMIHASSTNRKVVLQNVRQYLSWNVKLIRVVRISN